MTTERRYPVTDLWQVQELLVVVAQPAGAAEEAAEAVAQALAGVLQGGDVVDRGAVGGGQLGCGGGVQGGADVAGRDDLDLVSIDEAETGGGGDDQAVEQ